MLIVPEARTAILQTTVVAAVAFFEARLWDAGALAPKGKRGPTPPLIRYLESTIPQGTTVTATRTPG